MPAGLPAASPTPFPLPAGLPAASPRLDRSADRQAVEAAGDRLAQVFDLEHGVDKDNEPEAALCASAVSGREPPAGPQWRRGLSPLLPSALAYEKPLCASLDGFTLHAATRAGAHHAASREALLRYVLRPPIAQERVELQQDGLVRRSLERAFADRTVAVDMDPLSLLCRLAASVPPPRFHTIKYAGVLASASRPRWRAS
ncbi:transposase [Sorangium cellulosum]|uniref:transposase n=1 Tax=Sorangium cellulosum TaxID=56 RepID=UPI0012FFC4FA|nr:transposase [Sorangium cellulosum]